VVQLSTVITHSKKHSKWLFKQGFEQFDQVIHVFWLQQLHESGDHEESAIWPDKESERAMIL